MPFRYYMSDEYIKPYLIKKAKALSVLQKHLHTTPKSKRMLLGLGAKVSMCSDVTFLLSPASTPTRASSHTQTVLLLSVLRLQRPIGSMAFPGGRHENPLVAQGPNQNLF